MNIHRCAVVALGLFITAPVFAEQRFYQYMDAQGHIQTVVLPEKSGKASAENEKPKEAVASDVTPDNASDKPKDPSAVSEGSASPDVPDKMTGSASTSNEQEYLDSEELERSGFNREKKKRFYLLNDGVGGRIEESDGPPGGNNPDAASMFMQPVAPMEYFKILHSSPTELRSQDELQAVFKTGIKGNSAARSLCLERKVLQNARKLSSDISDSVLIDRKTWHFLGEGGVVAAFSVAGEGLRSIVVQSMSHSDRNPAFAEPYFVYADTNGCINRATTAGYFEHWLAATNSRHPMLQGHLTMLSGDHYLLVVLPGSSRVSSSDFPSSPDGVLAVKWQK